VSVTVPIHTPNTAGRERNRTLAEGER
jgi:hypothetical protein